MLEFRTTGKIVGRWDVTFTQKDHAYLQSEAMNVGTQWPVVRGASLYSTFHFYLVDGRWTCKHPEHQFTKYIRRVMDLTPPTKGMEEALTDAVEAQFDEWAKKHEEESLQAESEHLQQKIEKCQEELEALATQLTSKSFELEEYKRKHRELTPLLP